MTINAPRLLIGGTGSGCGKTTVTCAIMQALVNRGLQVSAFKCGPDYIDPMFHSKIIGARSRNLDAFLCGRDMVKTLFAQNSVGSDISVIEGVMGFYDGIGGVTDENSTADIANLTDTPAVLVMRSHGMSLSAAAQLEGFLRFRENTIKAVILNGISKEMCPYYRDIIEKHNGIKVLGCLPDDPQTSVESRHLGLVTAGEIQDLKNKLQRLAENAEKCIDLDALLAIAHDAPPVSAADHDVGSVVSHPVRVAVARDEAFCFTYEDSLNLLEKLGAELVSFSPLHDSTLPDGIQGLLLCGGYPELYAERLSKNTAMLRSIASCVRGGLPTIAECGGFMILHEFLDGFPMAGVISGAVRLTKRLSHFGYITLRANKDNLLCKEGEIFHAHEFHYSISDHEGDSFTAQKPLRDKSWNCIDTTGNLFAGYPHIHFCGNENLAINFMKTCENTERRVRV